MIRTSRHSLLKGFHLIPLLTLALSLSLSCKRVDDNEDSPKEVNYVRLQAVIATPAQTRANYTDGDVQGGAPQTGTHDGTDDERAVGHLRLLIFDKNTGAIVINKLYKKPGVTDASAIDFKQSGHSMLMDFELEAGTYTCVIVANEVKAGHPDAANDMQLSTITNINQLKTGARINRINTLTDPQSLRQAVAQGYGLVMVGSLNTQQLVQGGSKQNPLLIGTVYLERIASRLNIRLSNHLNNVIKPQTQPYSIQRVEIRNARQSYHLMGKVSGTAASSYLKTTGKDYLEKGYSHRAGQKFEEELCLYVMPHYDDTVTDPTTIKVYVEGEEEDFVYTIPKLPTPQKGLSILSNRFYDIKARLEGKELRDVTLEIHYFVQPWARPAEPVIPPFS